MEEMTCSICLELYEEPLMLPCTHTFCKSCLLDLVQSGQPGQYLRCPECRMEHVLDSQGVDTFPKNRVLDNVIQKYKQQRQKSVEEKRQRSQELADNQAPKCTEHVKEDMLIYCTRCSEMACLWCTATGRHKGHEVTPVDDVVKRNRVSVV
jgi:tripartite motif-containing protein 59